MNLRWIRTTLSAALAASVLACACNRAPQTAGGVAAGAQHDPSFVVAEVGERKITMEQLDKHVAAELREMEEQQFNIRRQALDQMVNQQLVGLAAAKKGQTEEQYLKESVDAKVPEPTDAQVKTFFDQNKDKLPPGAKVDDFKERIVAFMKRQSQHEQAQKVFGDLRRETNVVIHLNPPPKPRVAVEAKGPSLGAENAPITIVEFSDFECPFCSRAKDTAEQVVKKYDGKVRLVFRQFPLGIHANARKAAEAALCANEQGKFWPMHDALFANQQKLGVEQLKATAKELGLDATKFDKCLDSEEQGKVIDADMAAAEQVGVAGTPAFFINGIMLSGAQPIEEFERIINQELTEKG